MGLIFILLLGGCGSSGNTLFVQPDVPSPDRATVRLQSVLERAVPASVEEVRLTGYDSQERRLYGAETRTKARVIDFTEVPLAVTEVVIEYLTGGRVVGIARLQVTLVSGQIFVIDDPDFVDVAAELRKLTVTPATSTIPQGIPQAFFAQGTFSDGLTVDLTTSVTWRSSVPAVAEIDASGVASGSSSGNTIIYASLGGVTGEAALRVTDVTVTGLEIRPVVARSTLIDSSVATSPLLTIVKTGDTLGLRAIAILSDGETLDATSFASWDSDDSNVASVDGGMVTAKTAGPAMITAGLAGGTPSDQITINVVEAPGSRDLVVSFSASFDLDTGMLDGTDLSDWFIDIGTERYLILNSFTVTGSGTVLTFSPADQPFNVWADGEIAVLEGGEILRRGSNAGTNFVDGGPGGEVRLFSQGNLTVDGLIDCGGGDSHTNGAGGGLIGKNGGKGGSITLVSQGLLSIDGSSILSCQGGQGGQGAPPGPFGNPPATSGGVGGEGGQVSLISQGLLSVGGSQTIHCPGGKGGPVSTSVPPGGQGGQGGTALLAGSSGLAIPNSDGIDCSGGDGGDYSNAIHGPGGDGGDIVLFTGNPPAPTLDLASVEGGEGIPADGSPGTITIGE